MVSSKANEAKDKAEAFKAQRSAKHDRSFTLLVVDDQNTDWSKYFRAKKIHTDWDIRVEQVLTSPELVRLLLLFLKSFWLLLLLLQPDIAPVLVPAPYLSPSFAPFPLLSPSLISPAAPRPSSRSWQWLRAVRAGWLPVSRGQSARGSASSTAATTTLHYTALYCTSLHYTIQHYNIQHCTALNYIIVYCSVL